MSGKALLYCAGGGIGDSLVASVVARALHGCFETVDALTLPGHRDTLERVPDVDGVFVDDGEDERALAGAVMARGYDACVVTWATARTARVPQLARIPVRVGQARRIYSFRFTDAVVIRSENGDVLSHWSDILLDYARAIGCDAEDRAYAFEPTAHDGDEAEALQRELGVAPGAFIILNPCNAIASKRGLWPIEGWIKLAAALRERFAARILVSGAPGDAPFADAIAAAAGARDGAVTSIAGRLGIGAFGALARRARAFAGITTGSMHVAAAVGCPTAGIFPFQTDFPERWAPLGRCVTVVRPSYPCHRGDTKETCPDYACVANLDAASVVSALESIVSSEARS